MNGIDGNTQKYEDTFLSIYSQRNSVSCRGRGGSKVK